MKKLQYRDLLNKVSLRDIVSVLYPGKYVTKGGKSKCPLHEDKHPSFSIRTIDGIDRWKCFAGCGEGNSFDFLKRANACSNTRECLSWLSTNGFLEESFLASPDEKNYLLGRIEKEVETQELYSRFLVYIKDSILADNEESQKARDYLNSRGIEDVETICSKFYIGFYDYNTICNNYSFTKPELTKLGLLKNRKSVVDSGLCFIYQKAFGEFTGFKIRPLNSKKFIWFGNKNLSEKDLGFFGLNVYEGTSTKDSKPKDIILVEGEFDVLTPQYKALSMYGDVFGIACRSGGAASSPKTFHYLRENGIKNVTLFPDNDEGGKEFLQKCSKLAIGNHLTVDILWPSEYQVKENCDPSDLTKDLNANEIRSLIVSCRKPISKYLAEVSKDLYDENAKIITDSSNLRIKTINQFVDTANTYGLSDLMRDEFARELETLLPDPDITFKVLRRELERKTNKGSFIKINSTIYSIGKSGYEQWVPTDGEGSGFYSKITNFVIRYDKVVKFADRDEYEIVGHISVDGKSSLNKFTISSKDLVTPEQFNTLIRTRHPTGIEGLLQVKTLLPELVSQTNSETPVFRGIDRIGYFEDSRSYVTPSTVIEDGKFRDNTEYNVPTTDFIIRTFFSAIDYKREKLPSLDLKKSRNLILDVLLNSICRKNSIISLGHCYSSVLTPYFNTRLPPHALFFRGLAGSFKSTFAQVLMGLFYRDPFAIKWLHANDTKNSVEMALSYVNNAPMLLDDVKAERQGSEEIMMIIQSLYDEQGRSRLNKDLSIRVGRPVANQGLIVTGEIIPTSQLSILSRMIQLEFNRADADIERFDHLKDNLEHLRSLTPFFIKWLQIEFEDKTITPVNFLASEKNNSFKMERTYHQVRKILTGLDLFLQFMVEEVGLKTSQKDKLYREAIDYSKELMKVNISHIVESAKENVLLEEISGLIQTKLFSIWGDHQGSIEVGTTDSKGSILLNIPKLKIGMSKHSSLRDKLNLLNQMITDLEYQGKCKRVNSKTISFERRTLLGDSLNDESGIIS